MDGDLISRAEALKAIEKLFVDGKFGIYNDGSEIFAKCHNAISNVPAVDAEPVRHGTWEMRRKTIKTNFATLSGTYPTCSLCGHAEFGMDKSTPYCPGCGARMDGEEE